MRELGWAMQIFCDWRVMADMAAPARDFARNAGDRRSLLYIDAARGVNDANFQALLRLVGEGHVHVKVSAPYRLSTQFPDYPDARPFHERCCAPIRSG